MPVRPDKPGFVCASMKTLHDYHSDLQQSVPTITLLGQLPYNKDDLESLRVGLRDLIQKSPDNGLRRVRSDYSLVFALYLVLEGIYSYSHGEYWAVPDKTLRIEYQSDRSQWGNLFLGTLNAYDLPTFERLGGHKYVTPILAHAGIPNYCLDDFFTLLNKARRRRVAVDVPTLLDEWQRSDFPVNIDMPVQRFLLHGGPIAEDFVGRCLELWQPDGMDSTALGLPRRVLDRFDLWRSEQGAGFEAERADVQIPRPRLIIDPYGEGVAIKLAPVTIVEARAPKALAWCIEAGEDRRIEQPTYRRRRGYGFEYATETGTVNLLTVAERYNVSALADGEKLQSWTLPGPSAPRLLAFDAHTGELIIDRHKDKPTEYWLSPGERWLMVPRDWAIEAVHAQQLAELPPQMGEWANYTFSTWLLEPDAVLKVTGPEGEALEFRTVDQAAPRKPELLGSPLLTPTHQGAYSVYSGRPPDVLIPVDERTPLERWRVTVTPIGPAQPAEKRSYGLAELAHYLVDHADGKLMPLATAELLGSEPFGEFSVHLRGPYGRSADFDLRCVPYLALRDYPRLYLSDAEGPTEFQVVCDPDIRIAPGEGAAGLTIGPGRAVYPRGLAHTLNVPPALTRVPLHISRSDGVGIDLNLPAYRVRWGLWQPDQPEAFNWQTAPLRLHPKAIDGFHSAEVRVDLPLWPGAEPIYCGWRLVDAENEILQEQPPDRWRKPTRYYQTRVAQWLDSYHQAGGVACLQLLVDRDDGQPPTPLSLVYLLPTLELGEVTTQWEAGEQAHRITLLLSPDPPARGRVLRLWAEDRFWQTEPINLPLPDETDGYAEWTLSHQELPTGEYTAEMVVVDPWAADVLVRPKPDAPNTFAMRPDYYEAVRTQELAAAARGELDGKSALALLHWAVRTEQLAWLHDINYGISRQQSKLTIEQTLWWAETLRPIADSPAYKLAQLALFSPERVAALSQGQWPSPITRRYLDHVTSGLTPVVYEVTLPLVTGALRRLCLEELCRRGNVAGYSALLRDFAKHTVDVNQGVEWLLPNARAAVQWLLNSDDRAAEKLLSGLLKRHHSSDLIDVGGRILTDAGNILVQSIEDKRSGEDRQICRQDAIGYRIHGILWPDATRIPVTIDLEARDIHFRGGPLFVCYICKHVYSSDSRLSGHYKTEHRIAYSTEPVNELKQPYKHLIRAAPEKK